LVQHGTPPLGPLAHLGGDGIHGCKGEKNGLRKKKKKNESGGMGCTPKKKLGPSSECGIFFSVTGEKKQVEERVTQNHCLKKTTSRDRFDTPSNYKKKKKKRTAIRVLVFNKYKPLTTQKGGKNK